MNVLGRHFWMALLLHVILLALLSISVRCSRPPVTPVVIEAVLLDPSRDLQAKRQRQKEQQQRDADRAEQERLQQEQARQEEIQKLEKEERAKVEAIELQRRLEQEKVVVLKKQAEAAALAAALEKKRDEELIQQRQQKEVEEKKKLEEKKKSELALKKQRDEEVRRKELEQEDERLRQQLLDQEDAERSAAQTRRQQDSARAAWITQIRLHIEKNWLRPADSKGRVRCTVEIKQLPGGQIVSKRLGKSCGSSVLDESVLRAIGKSDPLPLPSDPAIFDRELVINFEPNDE